MPENPPLSVTLIQPDTCWNNIESNLASLEEMIWSDRDEKDLIILPEMFNTGFLTVPDHFAEPMKGRTFRWMRQMAEQNKAVVTGSLIISDKGQYYNRLIWMMPDGNYDYYDKRHLFRMMGEDSYFTAGSNTLIREIKGWRISPFICYDLRFPVWSRNRFLREENRLSYDILIFVANWPSARIQAWDVLLRGRAIENSSYCIGVNRTGIDGNGIDYPGHSAIYGPKGEPCAVLENGSTVKTFRLSKKDLEDYRNKFPSFTDNDDYYIVS